MHCAYLELAQSTHVFQEPVFNALNKEPYESLSMVVIGKTPSNILARIVIYSLRK